MVMMIFSVGMDISLTKQDLVLNVHLDVHAVPNLMFVLNVLITLKWCMAMDSLIASLNV
jgi:hypothetical protein